MTKKIKKICILGGGWSNEREISLKSSNDVFYSLRENGHDVMLYDMREDSFDALSNFIEINSIDIVFNLIHGEGGEDGLIQGYLDEIGVEYCGSGSHASSISFNKNLTKQIWKQKNLYTPEFILFNNQTYDDIKIKFGSSFFVKDTCSGSSNNIYLINNINDFKNFLKTKDNREYMIEEKIEADEYTAAILNDDVLPIIKIISSNKFYDFDAKYNSNETKFLFPILDEKIVNYINNIILQAFKALGCKTWARIDFFIDKDKIVLLEINTIPGMTDHSLVPKAAKKIGLTYYDLILKILGINA